MAFRSNLALAGVLMLVGSSMVAVAHKGHPHPHGATSRLTVIGTKLTTPNVDRSLFRRSRSLISPPGKAHTSGPFPCTGFCCLGFGLTCCAAAALVPDEQTLRLPEAVTKFDLLRNLVAESGYDPPRPEKPPRFPD